MKYTKSLSHILVAFFHRVGKEFLVGSLILVGDGSESEGYGVGILMWGE